MQIKHCSRMLWNGVGYQLPKRMTDRSAKSWGLQVPAARAGVALVTGAPPLVFLRVGLQPNKRLECLTGKGQGGFNGQYYIHLDGLCTFAMSRQPRQDAPFTAGYERSPTAPHRSWRPHPRPPPASSGALAPRGLTSRRSRSMRNAAPRPARFRVCVFGKLMCASRFARCLGLWVELRCRSPLLPSAPGGSRRRWPPAAWVCAPVTTGAPASVLEETWEQGGLGRGSHGEDEQCPWRVSIRRKLPGRLGPAATSGVARGAGVPGGGCSRARRGRAVARAVEPLTGMRGAPPLSRRLCLIGRGEVLWFEALCMWHPEDRPTCAGGSFFCY